MKIKKTRQEIRVESILIGRRIISTDGFREFSMRRVAKEVGCTVGTIYNVFTNQEDLLSQINTATLVDMHKYMMSRLTEVKSAGIERLRLIAHCYLEFARLNYGLWSMLFDSVAIQASVVSLQYEEQVQRLFDLIKGALSDICEHQDLSQAASTLWASVHGICSLGLSGKLRFAKPYYPEKMIDDLLNNYL